MRKKITPVAFLYTAILLAGCVNTFGQNSNTDLSNKRVTLQMSHRPLYSVFARLINKYDIAIGFEESSLDRTHRRYYFETNIPTDELKAEYSGDKAMVGSMPPFSENLISVDFKDAKLSEVLDCIVKQMANYKWEINDQVVNITPVNGRDLRLKELLERKISNFYLPAGEEVSAIQAQLMLYQREFKSFLDENHLEANTARPGSVFLDRRLPVSMQFRNLTFQELLNAITRTKRGGWILQIKEERDGSGREYVEILI
jgi:hypothetical protein